jgi:phosphatidylinositol kinase/protein kinase (PI-3  family)
MASKDIAKFFANSHFDWLFDQFISLNHEILNLIFIFILLSIIMAFFSHHLFDEAAVYWQRLLQWQHPHHL